MDEVHIVTVGTSIVRNAAQDPGLPPDLADRVRRWARATPGSKDDVEAGERGVPGQPEFRALYEILKVKPRELSAELNAMWRYLDEGRVGFAELLATDSGVCELCARLLKEYLTATHGVEAEVYRVEKLGRDFEEGLYNLLDRITALAVKHRGRSIYLNATGGFKPETAVVYAAACLLGFDRVYYIHEAMREVVEIPTIPLAVHSDYLRALELLAAGAPADKLAAELERRGIITRVGREYRLRKWVERLTRATA
ncbi:MAG: putative CRISPR-associated protein [Thermofilaceae archaeon]